MNLKIFFSAFLAAAGLTAATITPVDIEQNANRGRSGSGGWIGTANSDMGVLPSGYSVYGGIPFRISERAMILGKDFAKKIELRSIRGKARQLYLLHASAFCNKPNQVIGTVTISYKDGKTGKHLIRFGSNIIDWNAAHSVSNCKRVWTAYNGSTQVSLGITALPLNKKSEVVSIVFEGNTTPWMICGISSGEQQAIRALPTKRFPQAGIKAPSVKGLEPVLKKEYKGAPKNVILIIGDGMGDGAQKAGSLYAYGRAGGLIMEQFPYAGYSLTYSANSAVTDSAAGGTALATGNKTNNGHIAVSPEKKKLRTLAEAAHDAGKSVGILTNDLITGATPSAFTTHAASRGMANEIALGFRNAPFEIIIGGKNVKAFQNRKDKRDLFKEMKSEGVSLISSLDEFKKASGKRIFGAVPNFEHAEPINLFSQYAEESLKRLAKNPKGFFLMIEHTGPDHAGHGNNQTYSIKAILGTDWVVRAALEFVKTHPDTLIVVTADHETGGISVAPNPKNREKPFIYYATASHTGAPVPVWAVGPGAENFSGVMENQDVSRKIARLCGFSIGEDIRTREKITK